MQTAKELVQDWIDEREYLVTFFGRINAEINANDIVQLMERYAEEISTERVKKLTKALYRTRKERDKYKSLWENENDMKQYYKDKSRRLRNKLYQLRSGILK